MVAVIWILAAIVIAATVFSFWVDNLRDQALKLQQQAELSRREKELISQLLFSYVSGANGPDGVVLPFQSQSGSRVAPAAFTSLGDFLNGGSSVKPLDPGAVLLRMAGSVLDAGNGVRVLIQDRAGLIGLSHLNSRKVFRYFAESPVDSGIRVKPEVLKDVLRDYQDSDLSRSLYGAERSSYMQASLLPPADGFLRTPLQLREVMHWGEVLKPYSDSDLLMMFKAEGNALVNINTAPKSVLNVLYDSAEGVNSVIDARSQGSYHSVFDIPGGRQGEDFYFTISPSSGVRVWTWVKGSTVASVYDIQFRYLAPGDRAIYINWVLRVALPDELAKSTAEVVEHPFFH
ncbi:MAG: general secretion pathway protein GspK [Cellvibrionaceae bacterium]